MMHMHNTVLVVVVIGNVASVDGLCRATSPLLQLSVKYKIYSIIFICLFIYLFTYFHI